MSFFYDPISRKPKIWIYIAFVIVPLILVFLLFASSQSKVDEYKKKKAAETESDIFIQLDMNKTP